MPTNKSQGPSKMLSNLQELANGLTATSLTLLNTLIVLGTSTSKAQAIAQLKLYVTLFTAVTNAKQAYQSALSARKSALSGMHAYYTSLVIAVKQALGPNNLGQLPSLGIPLPATRKAPSAETKVIAKVKSAETRAARGTMGKKQRSAITATPVATVQVVGLAGSASASASSGTSTGVAAPPPAASKPATGIATPPAAS